MRQIKFRAWHPGWKRFIYFDNLKLNWSVYSPGGFFLDGQPTENIAYYCFKQEEVIIQQFTGLKDKNNKEIYEGDVVTGDSDTGPTNRIAVVTYEPFTFILKHPKANYQVPLFYYSLVVVGNVIEDPELLNKPPEKQLEEKEDERLDLKICINCGDRAWDDYICHACGFKRI